MRMKSYEDWIRINYIQIEIHTIQGNQGKKKCMNWKRTNIQNIYTWIEHKKTIKLLFINFVVFANEKNLYLTETKTKIWKKRKPSRIKAEHYEDYLTKISFVGIIGDIEKCTRIISEKTVETLPKFILEMLEIEKIEKKGRRSTVLIFETKKTDFCNFFSVEGLTFFLSAPYRVKHYIFI